MSLRAFVALGTQSQAPTKLRNHHGGLLRWDGLGFLFDPGEGTQRQFAYAGIAASAVTHVCITHFHGDHCLGLAGMAIGLLAVTFVRSPGPLLPLLAAMGACWALVNINSLPMVYDLAGGGIGAATGLYFGLTAGEGPNGPDAPQVILEF